MNSSSLQVSENGTLVASKLKHPLSVGWGEFLVLNSCVLNMYSLEISAVDKISYPPTKVISSYRTAEPSSTTIETQT